MLTANEEQLLIEEFAAWRAIHRSGVAKLYSADGNAFYEWLCARPSGAAFKGRSMLVSSTLHRHRCTGNPEIVRRRYRLTAERFGHPCGTVVVDAPGDYGVASTDSRITGIKHRSVEVECLRKGTFATLEELFDDMQQNGVDRFTCPVHHLEELPPEPVRTK